MSPLPTVGDEHGLRRPARVGAHGLDLLEHVNAILNLPDEHDLAGHQRREEDLRAVVYQGEVGIAVRTVTALARQCLSEPARRARSCGPPTS